MGLGGRNEMSIYVDSELTTQSFTKDFMYVVIIMRTVHLVFPWLTLSYLYLCSRCDFVLISWIKDLQHCVDVWRLQRSGQRSTVRPVHLHICGHILAWSDTTSSEWDGVLVSLKGSHSLFNTVVISGSLIKLRPFTQFSADTNTARDRAALSPSLSINYFNQAERKPLSRGPLLP